MTDSGSAPKPAKKGSAGRARGRATGAPAITRRTLSEQTYEALKERILDQRLLPGTRLNIDALARDLSVSSSPIREALVRLDAEKLVISELYSGYSVAPHPTLKYLHDLLDHRIVIEGHCARVGAAKRSRVVIGAMRQLSERMAAMPRIGTKYREYRRFVEADGRFHQLLVDSAENEVMSTTYSSLNAIILQSRLYLNRRGGSAPSDAVVHEHSRIFEAFAAGDGAEAEAAIRDHLEGGRIRLLSTLSEDGEPIETST